MPNTPPTAALAAPALAQAVAGNPRPRDKPYYFAGADDTTPSSPLASTNRPDTATPVSITVTAPASSRAPVTNEKTKAQSTSALSSARACSVTAPAQPLRTFFDPYVSSSTGHQRADGSNRLAGSTSWRDSLNAKLTAQYAGGAGGGRRVADSVGAGSDAFGKDGRLPNGGWRRGAGGLRQDGQLSIWESMNKQGKEKIKVSKTGKPCQWMQSASCRTPLDTTEKKNPISFTFTEGPDLHIKKIESSSGLGSDNEEHNRITTGTELEGYSTLSESTVEKEEQKKGHKKPTLFSNLCFYINGSTAPLISDHKLKHLLAEHGARVSIGLGRRNVTHVIVGTTAHNGGSGGGLAGSKLQKEIARVGGKGVKFVGAEWIVECIKAGKRLPTAPYSKLHLGLGGQKSLFQFTARSS